MTTEPRFISVGEILLDLFEDEDPSRFVARAGGAALNRARVAKSLGASAWLVGACGKGATGERLVRAAREWGIDTEHVRRVDARSGVVIMYRERVGGHRCVPYREGSANASEGAKRLRPKIVRSGWIVVDGILAAERGSGPAIEALVRLAGSRDVELCVDLNLRPKMWLNAARGRLAELVGAARIVKASTVDLETLGVRDPEGWLHKNTPEHATLVTTQGESGARAKGVWGELSSIPERIAVGDATGAGDAFSAGLIWRLAALREDDASALDRIGTWSDALDTATQVAEATVGRLGCDPDPEALRVLRKRLRHSR